MATDEAKLIIKFEAENKKLHSELSRTQKRLDGFEKRAKKNVSGVASSFRALAPAIGAATVVAAIGGLTRKVIENTKKQQDAIAQLEQGLKSTGNAAGRTLEELTAKAAELQKASTFGDEEIISAMSKLTTFTSIAGDEFDRTTQAVLDLSTRMGQDLTTSVVQLGKALNAPVSNLGALGRAGIQFNDDQKDLIKSLVKTNQLAKAQAIILDEVERQFGGSAQAARDTMTGALKALDNAFNDLFETTEGTDDLTESINELTDILQDPATVAAVQRLTSGLVSGMADAVDWAVKLIDKWDKLTNHPAVMLLPGGAGLYAARKLLGGNDDPDNLLGRSLPIDRTPAPAPAVTNVGGETPEFEGFGKRVRTDIIGPMLELIEVNDKARESSIEDFATLFNNLQRELDLYGETSEAVKLRYDIEHGYLGDISEAQKELLIDQQGRLDTLNSERELMEEVAAAAQEKATQLDEYSKAMAQNIQGYFADFLFDPFSDGLDGMLRGFVDMLRRMLAEALAADILGKMGFPGSGSSTNNAGGVISAIGSLFGGGFADGGRPDPNKISLVGERGPELFIPDGVSGTVMPNGAMNIKNINVLDPSIVGDYLATDAGEKVIVNIIRRNRGVLDPR